MSAYSDVILAESSLQSYWRLGEASGSFADSKGAITGTVVGSWTYGVASLIASDTANTAVANVTGYSNFGDNYDFTGTSNFSLECWIKVDATSLSNNAFLFIKDATTDGWELRILAAGAIRARRWLTSAFDSAASSNGLLVAGSTYHVVCTYDGTTLLVYLDTVQVATIGSTKSLVSTAANLTIGSSTGGGNVLTGAIDEAAIYNAALTPTQIAAHYSAATTTGQTLYPDADLDAASWTTAPLWSKVDETVAGGDVITATSA